MGTKCAFSPDITPNRVDAELIQEPPTEDDMPILQLSDLSDDQNVGEDYADIPEDEEEENEEEVMLDADGNPIFDDPEFDEDQDPVEEDHLSHIEEIEESLLEEEEDDEFDEEDPNDFSDDEEEEDW